MNTKIQDLKVGQTIWFFNKYGDLLEGIIEELKLNEFPTNHHKEIGESFDSVTSRVFDYLSKGQSCLVSVCAKQTMIYTSKPNQNEFVDDSVDFKSPCFEDDCNGTIYGNGWCDDSGEIVKFGYQECDTCGWNQAS